MTRSSRSRNFQALSSEAGQVFQPRAPINSKELFAGRWHELMTVADSVHQTGVHIVIFGERGVGKTSLANIIAPVIRMDEQSNRAEQKPIRLLVKVNAQQGDDFATIWTRAFDEIYWDEERPQVGFRPIVSKERVTLRESFGLVDDLSIDDVRRALTALPGSVFIFDEFDRAASNLGALFTDLIKALSDYSVESTVVLVGVSDTIDALVKDHASIVRAITQVQLPRMSESELSDILAKAAELLQITFADDANSLIVRMSQGLPHYTHLIGLHATRAAANRRSTDVELRDVKTSFEEAVRQSLQTIRDTYLRAIHSSRREALYEQVLLASAVTSSIQTDTMGYFQLSDLESPIRQILGRDSVPIATFRRHVNEFCDKARCEILERTGVSRSYKYRFRDPLLPPFVLMTAATKGVDVDALLTTVEKSRRANRASK